MSKPLILLVDDEADLVWAIQQHLRDADYEVLTARDGLEALSVAQRHNPDLVILDIGLPYLNGFEVCVRIRQDPALAAMPIIFLTQRNTNTDHVLGLEKGADNYLVKPVDLQILKAHIHAILRRSQNDLVHAVTHERQTLTLVVGEITLDIQNRQVKVDDRISELTPTEFDLLRFFMTHVGDVFTSYQILEMVWSYPKETADPCLVRWHIKNLRSKIERSLDHPLHILTMARHGYMLQA